MNSLPKYFISLNQAKPDASFETWEFISEETFRFFWKNAMICLYLSTNLSIGNSCVFKYAESYQFCTQQQRPKLPLSLYTHRNCHVTALITFPSGASLSLPLILAQVWHKELGAFLKHCFQTNRRGQAIQLPGKKYHTTTPAPYLCEHIFPLLKVSTVVTAAAALAVSAGNTTQGKPSGLPVP